MTVTSERKTGTAGELRGVDKWYGDHHVLTDVSVRIGNGEIVALIGRSGSGKSTVLRVLAGLSTDHTGERVVAGAPALAFQEPRLFPWRDVRTNVGYGTPAAIQAGAAYALDHFEELEKPVVARYRERRSYRTILRLAALPRSIWERFALRFRA